MTTTIITLCLLFNAACAAIAWLGRGYSLAQRHHKDRLELNATWTTKLNQHIAEKYDLERENHRLQKENAQALRERLTAYNQGFLAGGLETAKRMNTKHNDNHIALNA